ncbi:MAG: urease accessory protein UreD [Pseudomonadota bacterium]
MLSSSTCPSDGAPPAVGPAIVPTLRVDGRVDVRVDVRAGRNVVTRTTERGGYRLRFPRRGAVPEGILINTGGGVCDGDRLNLTCTVSAGAALDMTSQAAERAYRRAGPDPARIDVAMSVGGGAGLRWLPQETILFDRAGLKRRFQVDLAQDATFTACEVVVFGREAMGEHVRDGAISDQWRIRRDGQLVFADALRFDGDVKAALAEAAVAAGARVTALIMHVSEDAPDQVDRLRALLATQAPADPQFQYGVSGWRGLLVVRATGARSRPVRDFAAHAVETLTARPVPRVWQS